MTIEQLPANECLRLLRTAHVGRLAVVVDGRPDIFPLNFAVDHGSVVFRTAAGTKVDAIAEHHPVAFEVDGQGPADDGHDAAWSVVIKGTAVRLRGTDLIDTETLTLNPYEESAKPIFVRIEPEQISGRIFPIADQRVWVTERSGVRPSSPE